MNTIFNKSVLQVGNFLSSRGFNRQFIEDLSDHLEAAGWAMLRTSTSLSRPLRLADMALTVWRRRGEFSVGHITVLSGPAFIWAEVAALVMRVVRRPYVLSLHGGNLPLFAKHWPNRTRRLLKSAAVVVTPSNYLLKKMSSFRPGLVLLPNPIELNRYRFSLRDRPRPNLVWMRAFHKIYNPSLAPKVLASLIRDFPDIRLLMIGPSKGDGSLEAMTQVVTDLGVVDHMDLPGKVPKAQVSDWLNRGDIFINTTNIDNTPISILEAMACGLCVVSTNVGGIPYLLEDGHDALLVSPDDPEAMAAAVHRILNDSKLAGRLSQNARKKVEQFDWSIVLPRWESMFTAIIEGNESAFIKQNCRQLSAFGGEASSLILE